MLKLLAALVAVGLLLGPQGGTPLTRAQKDSLLSRKKWYLTVDFTIQGSGSGTNSGGGTNNWRVNLHTTSALELNYAAPGQWPPSTPPDEVSDPTPGRFIGWMTMPTPEAIAASDKGVTNPAELPSMYFPFHRETNVVFEWSDESQSHKNTYTGVGDGFATGPCLLALDLKNGTYDAVFQLIISHPGPKIHHEHQGSTGNDSSEELPDQFTAWLQEDARPFMAKRDLSKDLKPDGTIAFTVTGNLSSFAVPNGTTSPAYTASFTFSPNPPSTAKLLIGPEDDDEYRAWRPIPGQDESTAGSEIRIKWEVVDPQARDGKGPEVNKVTLRLGRVSRYPGVCMNWPPPGQRLSTPPPDLQFNRDVLALGAGFRLADENQTLIITGPAADRGMGAHAIKCFDGAAIGELVAEAELKDGRILTGELKGQPALKKLLIPDREDGVSDLAKGWRRAWASGLQDGSDDETVPEGDKDAPGDGLTVWEEYRGFYMGGEWSDECDTQKKDLFLENRVGGQGEGGIALFRRATGLAVHDTLLEKEHLPDRVVNFNKRTDRRVADQHCLILRISSNPHAGRAESQFGANFPGPPKNTLWVNVVLGSHADRIFGTAVPGVLSTGNSDSTMIAHELGHGVGMYHHGDKDEWTNGIFGVIWMVVPNTSGIQLLEHGAPIAIVDEPSGAPVNPSSFIPAGATEYRAYLGLPNGQHSGDYHCIMRYSVARFYVFAGASNVRVRSGSGEITGATFCGSPAPTEFNLDSNLPNSRFRETDTTKKRGNCIHQFVISDRWEKKDRR